MLKLLKNIDRGYKPRLGALDIIRYIGPGFLVTVGFIDPGNWASNLAAGSFFGYKLLWMVSLSTLMLIVLQHNVAHLGIVKGVCLSEAASIYLKRKHAVLFLLTAMIASAATSMAEILGGAVGLAMLTNIPVKLAAFITASFSALMLFANTYKYIEKWIIAFVSLIGLSFIYELSLVHIDTTRALMGWIKPSIPEGSMLIIMSVLGAVVMPHNLFLHSEIVQSKQWHKKGEGFIAKRLKYEFFDTLLSMGVGWAINSAMILLAAAVFFEHSIKVETLTEAATLLSPLLGSTALVVFAVALLLAGISSTITSGMAAGVIFAGLFKEPYDIKDNHTRTGIVLSFTLALLAIMFISNPFNGLIVSQALLGIQLPLTVFVQIRLTSSNQVMGKFRNSTITNIVLYTILATVLTLNIMLLLSYLWPF